ncbi:unnamed protein product [Durusdinium trenchii]|uniref:AB hydrolase-1 domain-containing protein n=1 Tax=Durusdinium trenchii TaxID=1381693 RepID=A0ABP0HG48_9DINO
MAIAQVAPEQAVMTVNRLVAATPSKVLNPHPKLIRVVVSVRVDAGQAEDGRIIEYYTYGSEDREAQILLQINGRLFKEMTGIVNTFQELKIRGISISLPGHGFSSNHPSRRIGDWPRQDVRPVFEKENITGQFMVAGMSFGSSHAMAVMHEFPERVTHAHLLVPYLPVEVRRQEGWKLYGQDDALRCEYQWASGCWPRTCCLYCCCSMCFNCCCAG